MDYVMYVKYYTVFTIAPRLYHLKYWLAARHRHLSSLLKAEPFKIPKTSATTGQKVVALQLVPSQPEKSHDSCASVTLPPEFSTAEIRYYARFLNAHTVQILNNF